MRNMSLELKYKYKVCKGVGYTNHEEQKIIRLLKDVRTSVALLRPDFENKRLEDILEVVEKGKLIFQKEANPEEIWVELNYKIDLSEAKEIIDDYRYKSEGGCQSCKRKASFMPFSDEHVTYCSLYENESTTNEGSSPRITQFYNTGCDDKEVIFNKKIEEIIKENN